jgi:hypothetical protein
MSASLFVGQKLENGSGYGRTLLADEKNTYVSSFTLKIASQG